MSTNESKTAEIVKIAHLTDIPEICSMTEAQIGVYIDCLEAPEDTTYNVSAWIRLSKDTDVERYVDAILRVADAHPMFFVTAELVDGIPCMRYQRKEIFVDRVKATSVEEELKRFIRPFDLKNGPLYRFEICDCDNDILFLIDLHHLIADGTSMRLLVQQVEAAYRGEDILPEELTQFDISAYEKDMKSGERYRRAQEFFEDKLKGVSAMSLPGFTQSEGNISSGYGRIEKRSSNLFNIDVVKRFITSRGITENTLFLAAFAYTAKVFSGSEDVCFTTISNGRHHGDHGTRLSESFGMFVKTLPLRLTISDSEEVPVYLERVNNEFINTRKHDCISFGELVSSYGINTDISFVYQGDVFGNVNRVLPSSTDFAVEIQLFREIEDYRVVVTFDRTRYTESYLNSLTDTFISVVQGLLTCDRLSKIQLISKESEKIYDRINATDYPLTSVPVHKLFEKKAAEYPDRIAIAASGEHITMSELNTLANRVAGNLVSLGLKREGIVGIVLPRKGEAVIAELAIWKASGVFLPMTPSYPDDRISYCLENSGAEFVITTDEIIQERSDIFSKDHPWKTLSIEKLLQNEVPFEGVDVDPTQLAYCIYTSGSTGKPKGVMIEHRNFCNYLNSNEKHDVVYKLVQNGSMMLCIAALSFDFSMLELWAPLCNGIGVCIATDEDIHNPFALAALIKKEKVDLMGATPSYLLGIVDIDEVADALKNIRCYIVGAEAFPGALYEKLRAIREDALIINGYGPTEATVSCTSKLLTSKENITIGKPTANVQTYILDKENRLLPLGAPGELIIAGAGVGRGYMQLPDKTAEVFFELNGKRAYRSGDFCRLNMDGEIEFFGRIDNQVKLRGLRIELDEVENTILTVGDVKSVKVVVRRSGTEDFLAGFYTASRRIDPDEIKLKLKEALPPYMVPAVLVQLEKMPLNTNGKIDKKALPEVSYVATELTAPENSNQQKIYDAVVEILGHEQFGIDTDFYEAGLASIGAIRLTAILDKQFGIPFSISDMRNYPTVRQLEAYVREKHVAANYELQDDYPLTKTQEGIAVECITNPGTTVYNIPFLIRMGAGVDADRLVRALKDTVNAHPYLKTRLFTDENGHIRARRCDNAKPSVIFNEGEPNIEKLIQPFDLLKDELYRLRVWKNDSGVILFSDFHHIVFDGTSESIFFNDLNKAYAGETPNTEEYTGFEAALDEQSLRDSEAFSKAKDYYAGLLENCDTDNLPPLDPKIGEEGTGRFSIDSDIPKDAVERFCKKYVVSENVFFNSVFGYVLCRLNNRDDIVYATVYNGRNDSRKANSVSMYVKTLPVRCAFDDDSANIAEFVQSIGNQLSDSMANDIYSFADISGTYGVRADVLFAYQGAGFNPETLCKEQYSIKEYRSDSAKASMMLEVFSSADGYRFSAEFREKLYSEELMRSMVECVIQTAREFIVKDCLCDIDLLSCEQKELLDELNRTKMAYDVNRTVIDLFREKAKQFPDRTAVIFCDKTYTYTEADRISDKIAVYLLNKGISYGDVVAVLIKRSEYMPLISLGVLKAGAAYQPLDSSYPEERLNFMVADSAAKLLIADEDIIASLTEWNGETLMSADIPNLPELSPEETERLIKASPRPDDLFILLYTSGSTGTPKGVMLAHKNIVAFCHQHIRRLSLDESSIVATYASFGFDANMMDTYPALCAGATLVVVHEEIRLDLNAILEYYKKLRVTHAFMTTQIGRQFALLCDSPYLKYISLGGEALVPVEVDKDIKLFNFYGPTEATVYVTSFDVKGTWRRVPIGKPVENVKLYVTDKNMARLPIGVPGELCVAGSQVSAGYLNRPEKTAEVFVKNPFDVEEGYERIYRTGDIVRLLPDGSIDFIGRNDGQVKVRGFRIELSEVEEVIRRFEGIADATVTAFETPNGGKELAAYVVSDKTVNIQMLKDFIRGEKPPYMVPAVIMQIDKIPLNQNQKVNKKALPKPELGNADSSTLKGRNGILTECEKQLLAILKETANIITDDVTSDLISLGISSILAISFVTVVEKRFSVDFPVAKIMQGASVMDIENEILLSLIAGKENTKTAFETKVSEIREEYPLTQTQLGIYYETMQHPESTLYNIPFCLKFSGIDSERLCKAIENAVMAHSYLNTYIKTSKNGFVQVRNDESKVNIMVEDAIDADIEQCFRSFIKPFNLHQGPLYRFKIVNVSGALYLMMDFHHIIFDGFSMNLFMDAVKQAYETGAADTEEYSYFEYSLDDEKSKESEEYAASEAYFANMLSDFENTTEMPSDISGKAENGQVGIVTELLDEEAVNNFCKENRITASTLFLASTFYTVSRFASVKDVYITTISNGRAKAATRKAIGMFVRTIPVAIRPKDGMNVLDYIKAAADTMNGSIANENYPFTEIAGKYGYGTDIMYECQLGVTDDIVLDGHTARTITPDEGASKFKLKIAIMDSENGIQLRVGYNDALYSEKYMRILARSLKICTERMMADISQPIKTLSLLSGEDEAVLGKFSETELGEIKPGLVHKMFEEQVAQHPDKKALIACDCSLTYSELDRLANRIANSLILRGVQKDDMVVILLPRRAYYFAAAFGVMKSGAAFIPCDPQYPTDRIQVITEDSGARYIVTTKDKQDNYPAGMAIDIEELLTESDETCPNIKMIPEDLVYSIYTSGSTGKPKGVEIRHIGVCNYFTDTPSNILYHQMRKRGVDSVLSITTVSFDLSMKDTFGMLCNGKTLIFANENQMNDPNAITALLNKYDVQMFSGTASRLLQYMEYSPFVDCLKQRKMIICGGELFPTALMKRIQELTDAMLINSYGPTEITISSNMADLTHADHVSVGKPLYNYSEYIVDSDGNLLPPGIIGELYVGGPGVARGYRNLEERTREAFVEYQGHRIYKTGDYAKWDEDGNVMILGRKDNQVKLRGLRIELGEIENVISQQQGVKQALVMIKKLSGQDTLCAYYTASEKLNPEVLRDKLKTKLTHYMVPGAYLQLDAFPTNANGKTDRKALPDPVLVRTGEYVEASGKEERFFCDLFAKILKLEKVGAEDNFFECGGSSLTVTSIVVASIENGYKLSYSDIFGHATPRELAKLVSAGKDENRDPQIEDYDYSAIQKLLSKNSLDSFRAGEKRELGNILLTGATGYMGIHVLQNFLKNESGKAYCMVRKGKSSSALNRLRNMYFYYFEDDVCEAFDERVEVVDGDVTKYDTFALLEQYDIQTVFNCAANVKHFSTGTDIEDINIGGVENCIAFCRKKNARLIHFSTTSTAGTMIVRDGQDAPVLDEHTLWLGQKLDNKYTHSKFIAERTVLNAIIDGLDAKVIRVGTLSPRKNDGEFQINYRTNSFMGRLRTYSLLGFFPYSICQSVIRMGAIDVSVDAFMHLAKTPSACCLFNACSNHTIFLADIVACLQERGHNIRFVEVDEFRAELLKAGEDPAKAAIFSSLIAYLDSSADEKLQAVGVDCTYTNDVLCRMGFLWNITDKLYIEKFITALEGLSFFDAENLIR